MKGLIVEYRLPEVVKTGASEEELMKKAVLFAAGVMLFVVSTAYAIDRPQPCSPTHTEIYFKLTEMTIIGEVESVTTVETDMGVRCVELALTTGTETLLVHIGPAEFVERNKIQFTKGETLEMIGSRTKENNVDAFLPREIKQGVNTIMLRDRDGRPLWHARPRIT